MNEKSVLIEIREHLENFSLENLNLVKEYVNDLSKDEAKQPFEKECQ
jgi:hypothetical protein